MRRAATAALCCLVLGSCATIIAGGPDEIPVTTNPPGAYVYLNGQVVGQTPMVITLDRSRAFGDIRIYYPGFNPVVITRYKNFNLWTIGNFFIGMIPVIVDIVTNNWQRFDEDEIAIALTPGQAPPPYGVEPRAPRGPQAPPSFGSPPPNGPPMQPPQEPRPPAPN